MVDSQDFKEPKVDSQVVTKFLPALMVDDQCRSLHSKLSPDERESALTTIEHSGPAPDAVEANIQESSVASILAMYYTLNTARQKYRVGDLGVLAILSSCKDDRAYEDPFLHSMIALLIPMTEEFTTEDFCTMLFDEFPFAGLNRDNVTSHMIKFLWYVHNKLPSGRLASLMKAMQPTTGHNETVHKLYETFQERIGASLQEGPVAEQTEADFDSPLKSVPTPGPHSMQ